MVISSKASGSIIMRNGLVMTNVRTVDQSVILVYQVMAGVVSEMVMVWGNSVMIHFECSV